MRPNKKLNPETCIKLLLLFERQLKKYNSIFDNDFYQLNYVISRKRFPGDIEIKIIFSIVRHKIFRSQLNESESLKQLLESYCSYFSITDILIVKPFNIKKNKPISNGFNSTPIEERLSIEIYR
jgi:hypothetical protein